MRRSKRKTVFAGILSAAIIVQGMGVSTLPVEANEQKKVKTIIAVEELDETVSHQEVEFGTSEDQLIFPKRLEATVLIDEDEEMNIPVASPSDAEADQTASPSEAEEGDYEEDDGEEQETVSVPIKWELNEGFSVSEEYDGEIEGIYVFDAALKNEERYQLDTELPRIEITVSAPQAMAMIQNVQSNVVSGDGWTLDLDESLLTIETDQGMEWWINEGKAQYQGSGYPKTLILGDQVTEVPGYAFDGGNSKLEKVVLGESVKEIGESAFSTCSFLKEVSFNENLEQIGDYAFSGSGIENIDFNVKKIGVAAFSRCKNLENVNLGGRIEEIETDAFLGCETLKEVIAEGNIKKIGDTAFRECYALEYASINAEEIGSGVFFLCRNLREASIGWNMQSIGRAVFEGCTALQKVWICGPIQTIDSRFFVNCANLKDLRLLGKEPPKVESGAFDSVPNDMVIHTITQTTDKYKEAFEEIGLDFEIIGDAWCFHTVASLNYDDIYHWEECERCGTVFNKENHYGGTATETERAICEVCGAHYGEVATPCKHENLSEYKSDEINHWKECLDCKAIVEKSPHYGGTATETEQAVCEACGAHYGELATPCEHTNLSGYQFDEFDHWRVCLDCGRIVGKENHHGGIATEQEKAICEICGASYGELAPSDPDPNDPSNPSEPSDPGTASSGTGRSDSDRNTTTNQFTAGVDGKWRSVENRPMTWQFIRNNGTMLWNMWAYIDNPYAVDGQPHAGWFYFDQDGIMQYDWYQNAESGKWYYLHSESDGMLGTMEEGWHYENRDGNWYYMKPGAGEMATGWQYINGKWYYFNVNVDQDTWYYDEEKNQWIYHANAGKPYGAMYCDEITPDGYRVDENGAWIAQ